jgi:alpha-glucosidase
MQPVFFADPQDVNLRGEDRAFLLGPNLLVVPRWVNDARLPKGIWRDVSLVDEKREQDGYQATVKIRGGAIVPLGKVIQNTGEESLDPLTLLVCLDAHDRASGDLYEDASDGFDYTRGEYALTHYVAVQKGDSVVVRIRNRNGKLKVPDRKIQVCVITADGAMTGGGQESAGVIVSMGK